MEKKTGHRPFAVSKPAPIPPANKPIAPVRPVTPLRPVQAVPPVRPAPEVSPIAAVPPAPKITQPRQALPDIPLPLPAPPSAKYVAGVAFDAAFYRALRAWTTQEHVSMSRWIQNIVSRALVAQKYKEFESFCLSQTEIRKERRRKRSDVPDEIAYPEGPKRQEYLTMPKYLARNSKRS